MAEPNVRETELVLAPNEHAFVLDKTKGYINVITGPNKTSLSTSDSPVVFDVKSKRFVKVDLERSVCANIIAPKGFYLILKNPAKDGKQPATGSNTSLAVDTLIIGQKVNISGPTSFALWPGQLAKVVRGHTLRFNEYIVARVYDEDSAKANWSKAVIKKATPEAGADGATPPPAADAEAPETYHDFDPAKFTTGQVLIIKGTDVSFYIPPTGIEVEFDTQSGKYVRDAVTLERLEYCILKDEDGNKRFVRGPNVVFPKPTEQFLSKNSERKFRAVELNEQSGLYIKVIEDYAEDGKKYVTGQELFITGKAQSIYFPRPEHAIIKYGDQEKHFAIAIPKGEARYVLQRDSGNVKTLRGPAMFLPDPRNEVVVRKILEDKECDLLYPGNTEALLYNQKLRENRIGFTNYVEDMRFKNSAAGMLSQVIGSAVADTGIMERSVAKSLMGNQMDRGSTYTPPRTITLDNKYEGAVTVNVFSGYAVQVVNKSGQRRVVAGPATLLLEYDEYLEPMTLSRGRPKTTDSVIKTAYLRVLNNRVGDVIDVVTEDLVNIKIDLQYLVKFTGDSDVWFSVDNYVQYMTHHMRSLIINTVRKQKAAEFYVHGTDIVRDLVLGAKAEGEARTGRLFEENGMLVYEVEVLDINITDKAVKDLLTKSHFEDIQGAVLVQNRERELENSTQIEEATRGILEQNRLTSEVKLTNTGLIATLEATLAEQRQTAEQKRVKDAEDHSSAVSKIRLARAAAEHAEANKVAESKLAIRERENADRIRVLLEEANAYVKRGEVVTPQLVAALTQLAQGNYLENLKDLAPLSIIQGTSLEGTMKQLFAGTPLEQFGQNLVSMKPGAQSSVIDN